MTGYRYLSRIARHESRLSMGARLVYCALIDFALDHDNCNPTQTELAEAIGVSTLSIKRYSQELREFGLIKVYQRAGRSVNLYVLIAPEKVENLTNAVQVVVNIDEQYYQSDEAFESAASANRDFCNEFAVSAIVPTVTLAADDGVRELCRAFARKYKDTFNREYALAPLADPAALRLIIANGEGAFTHDVMLRLLDTYVEMYQGSSLYSKKFPRPRISGLKFDFVLAAVMERMADDVAIQERADGAERLATTEGVWETW